MIFNLLLSLFIVVVYFLTRIGDGKKKTKDKVFLTIVFIVLFVIVAFREMTVGSDTSEYIRFYERCGTYGWRMLEINDYFEYGYTVFNIVLNGINISPRVFLCIIAFITNFAIYWFIKQNSNNYLMSVLIFINLLFFYESMNTMRQFLALSMVLLFGFKAVKERRLFRFIIVTVIASLFHSTALLMLLLYPVYRLKYTRKRVIAIIAMTVIIAFSLNQIYPFIVSILDRGTYYLEKIGDIKLGNIIMTIAFLAMYLFSLIVIDRREKPKYSFYLYVLLFSVALSFISINMSVLNRASQYYAIFSIVALPNIIEANIVRSKKTIETSIVGLFMVYSSVIMINKPEWNTAFDYRTCLIQEEGYVCK